MQATPGRKSFYYAGFVMLLALLVGGGTEQGLWTDHLIEVALVPATIIGFGALFTNRFTVAAKTLALLVVALCAWQFFPLPRAWPPGAESPTMSVLFSPAPGRSLEAATYLLTMLGFALFIARFPDADHARMVRFVFMGLVVNAAIGAVQLSFALEQGIVGVLPYAISSAVFANENHLSAFVVATIPLIAWRFLGVARQFWTYLGIVAALLVFLFAVGSRAGMVLSVAMAVLMIVWFATSSAHAHLKGMAMLVVIAAVSAGVYAQLGSQLLDADLRAVFFRNTMTAIGDFWPLGSGVGTFRLVYPLYEKTEEILHFYANQAHNDYLQILLETGVAGGALMIAFGVLAFMGMARSKLAQAAFLAMFALLLHSLVDYPLRTAAIATTFAFLSGILLSRPEPAATPQPRR